MEVNQKLQHRRASKTVTLVRTDGSPAANTKVTLRQTQHKFLFGCGAFDVVPLVNGELQGEEKPAMEERFEKWLALFNAGTLPFYWGRYEGVQGKPGTLALKKAAEWLKAHGVTAKGHPLCWHTATAPWLLGRSNDEILKLQLERIRRDVTNFKGLVDLWDAINEVVIMPVFDKEDNGITRVCKEFGRIPMVREVFAAAKEANPGAALLINDFNTSAAYEILIEGCLEAGIPIDGIGIQSHQHQGYWGLDKTLQILERFSHFGLPIHFTENTLISGALMPPEIEDLNDWQVDEWPTTPDGEDRQAKEVTELYTALFEHPLVESVTTWSIVDDKWLHAPAGLLRRDNSCKPAYDELQKLIKRDWWTTRQLVTDPRGKVTFSGFLGNYEIVCGKEKAALELDKSGTAEKVLLK